MPRRAASHDHDALAVQEFFLIVKHSVYYDALSSLHHTAADAVAQGIGLLEYLLQHEVRVATLLQLRDGHLQLLDVDVSLLVVQVCDLQRHSAAYLGYLAILQIHGLLGVFHERRGVRRQEELVFAYAYHKRRALACGDYDIGVGLVHHRDGVGSHHLLQRLAHCLQQRALVGEAYVFYELYQHLGIGLRLELAAMLFQRVLQHLVVLDGAVVH